MESTSRFSKMKFIIILASIMFVHISALQPGPNNVAFKRGTMTHIADFKELTKCTTYVDKTMLIADFFKSCAPRDHHLITCPHKFGKSINLDMLKSFVDVNTDNEFFRKFNVGPLLTDKSDFYKNHFRKYNVIHLNFKITGAKTYSEMFEKLSKNVKSFQPLVELLNEIATGGKWKPNTQDGLLRNYYPNSNTFLFIDDYDSPIINAIEYNMDVARVMSLIDTILFALFNTRDHRNIQHVLITGTLCVLDEKKFGSIKHWNFLNDHRFVQYFGFTENEVDKLLDYHGVTSEEKQTVKQFYQGYNCCLTSTHMYDPFSIASFLTNRDPNQVQRSLKHYWAMSGQIPNFFQAFKKYGKLQELLKELLSLKNVTFNMKKSWNSADLEELKVMTHNNVTELTGHRVDIILSYLFHHGYLTRSDQAGVYGVLYENEFEKFISSNKLFEKDGIKKLFFE